MRYNKKTPQMAAIVMANRNNHAAMVQAMAKNGFQIRPGENITKKLAIINKINPAKGQKILKESISTDPGEYMPGQYAY